MIVNYGPASRIADDEILVRLKEVEDQGLTITERLSGIEIDIDSVETKVSEAVTTAAGTDQKVTTLTQDVDSITAKVEKIEGSTSDYTEIKATLDGLTITTENGKTIIDGGNINAKNLKLTGAITWDDIGDAEENVNSVIENNTTVTGAANDAQSAYEQAILAQQQAANAETKAENAEAAAGNGTTALNQITNWINGTGTTKIDSKSIIVPTIYSNQIHLGGKLTVYTTTNGTSKCGYLGGAPSLKDGTPGVHFMSSNESYELAVTNNGARFMQDLNNQAVLTDGNFVVQTKGVKFYFNGDGLSSNGVNYPGFYVDRSTSASGSAFLGSSVSRWKNVYTVDVNSTNSVTVSSDRNVKNSIEDLPEKYVALFDNLRPTRFKLNEGASDRYHVGFISQEVEEAMIDAGIDSQEFGGFVIDKCQDENGDTQEQYMLRYEEFIGILTAKIKQLESRIEELEAK